MENLIKDKIPMITKFFVKIYGEKYKNIIEERLNNSLYLFADNSDENFSKEKLENFLNQNNLERHDYFFDELEDFISDPSNIAAFVNVTTVKEKSFNAQPPYCICVLPTKSKLDNMTLMHELGHIVQSNIPNNNDFTMFIKQGLSLQILDKNVQIIIGNEKTNLLNEVFNEYLTCKIDYLMKKYGKCIGNKENKVNLYSCAFPFLKKFFDENMECLISSAMSNDPDLIYKKFGKENIEALTSSLCRICKSPYIEYIYKNINNFVKKGKNLAKDLDKLKLNLTTAPQEFVENVKNLEKTINAINNKAKNIEYIEKI